MVTSFVDTPLAAEKLSASQPLIRSNFQTSNTIMSIDHYPFADLTTNAGKHKQITFPASNLPNPAVSPASGTGYLCINNGVAGGASNNNLIYFNNANYPLAFILNAVRAFGSFQGRNTAGACTLNNGRAITCQRNASVGSYTCTITNNFVTGTNYLVFVNSTIISNNGGIANYSITSATNFNIGFFSNGSGFDPGSFSVMVIQA